MAGTFSKSALPKRPGAYFAFQARKPIRPVTGSTGTIAVVAEHTWGPINTPTFCDSFSDWLAAFGAGLAGAIVNPSYSPGYRAARDAFRGEDLPGYQGAGAVWFYRIANSTAAAASKQLSNGATNAITLTGRYPGTYGNQITVTVMANAADPTNKHDLVLYVEGSEVERYTYAKTNITDLAAQINGTTPYASYQASKWATAGAVTSGTALSLVTAQAFAGGLDGGGGSITPADHSAARTALEPYRFSVLAIDSLVDPTVQAATLTWLQNLNTKGKRFVSVFGGAAGETMATATARAATFNDPNVVNVGGGTFTDPDYGALSTAQLAPRIAGIIAQRGETAEITFARLNGLTVTVGNTEADILSALAGGTVALSRDSHPTAPVRIELGITSFTNTSDPARPLNIYSNLKFMRVMGGIETELTEWAEQNVIGRMQVNDATRDYIRGQLEGRIAARERAGIVLPGWTVNVSQVPPPQPTDNFVAIDYTLTLGRGLQQVLNTVTVG